MQRHHGTVHVGGEAVSWLGANFWSRTGGPLMWRTYDGAVVRSELAVLARHGLRQTRSFLYWPDFHPEPHRVDDALVAHVRDFLDAHAEHGMTSIPTFVVGHMSGENWSPAWRGDRDLYADVWLVGRQAWFVERMTRAFADHPAVTGWLISNEMPIYGRRFDEPPAPTEQVSAWAQLMVNAVRAGGGTQPVSLGDGAWGIEVTGDDNGFSVRETGALVDFVGPHVYRMEDDQVRQHLNAAFLCELAAVGRRPVVLEEFGVSTDFVSSSGAASYYRQTLHNSLLGGATGWIAWNNTDYDDLAGQDPYRHHPFEMHFGITDRDGEPKSPLLELRAFADVLEAVDLPRCRRDDVDAALVVSSYLERAYPFTRPEDRRLVFASVRQAYVAAHSAGLPVGLTREEDGVDETCRLYLAPSTRQLTAPTWQLLQRLADGGAVVYVSYCAGDSASQRAGWWPRLDDVFGVEHQLRYGLTAPVEDDVVRFSVSAPFGDLVAGDVLEFRAAGDENSRAFLPVTVQDGAEVVATDGRGRPAVVRRRTGSGSLVLCTYPLEYMAARTPHVNPEATHRLYAALAAEAGIRPPVRSGDPLVFTDTVTHADGRRFAWFVSQDGAERTVTPRLATRGGSLYALGGGEGRVDEIALGPYGVGVFEIRTDG
jgi:endo-1,4-beta-mannosidase